MCRFQSLLARWAFQLILWHSEYCVCCRSKFCLVTSALRHSRSPQIWKKTVPRIRRADITCYILHTVSIAVPHPFNAIQISPFGSSTLIYSHLLSSFVHSLFPLEIQDPRLKSLIWRSKCSTPRHALRRDTAMRQHGHCFVPVSCIHCSKSRSAWRENPAFLRNADIIRIIS